MTTARPIVRSAIVTGAASGIGARAVTRLRGQGAHVVASDLAAEGLRAAAADGARTVVGDITQPGVAEELVATALDDNVRIDLLLHCAGIMPGGRIRDIDPNTVDRVMRVNYGGTVRVVNAVLPHMRARGGGRIVVLGSLTGYVPTPGFGAYSASKAAVNMFVETLAHEERDSGVQVLLVAPTAVKTPLLSQARGGPGFVGRLADRASSPLMISIDDVLDAMERGLAKRRRAVTPGGRAAHAARRLSPRLAWWLADRLDH